jgi:hypothetical protein
MGKLRQWLARWFDYHLEKSLQRQADKIWRESRDNDRT